jgi:hypothetical protein
LAPSGVTTSSRGLQAENISKKSIKKKHKYNLDINVIFKMPALPGLLPLDLFKEN